MQKQEAIKAVSDILAQVRVALLQEGIHLDALDVETYDGDMTGAEVILRVKTPSTYTHKYVMDLKEIVPVRQEPAHAED